MTPEPSGSVEQAAWTAQYAGLAEVDPSLGALAVEVAGLHVYGVAGWPDSAWHATVTGAGLDAPATEKALDVALTLLGKIGAQRPGVQVAEGAEPAGELPRWLAARDLVPGAPLLRLQAPAVAGSTGDVQVAGPGDGATVAAVCLQGFGQVDQRWWRAGLGRPGWTQVLLRAEGTAVATAALFVAGEHAWLGSATTVPGARRAGAHRALVAARVALAAEQGARTVSVRCAPARRRTATWCGPASRRRTG